VASAKEARAMTADQHPEELIDRARQAALDPEEQATLDRHLAACSACAAHLSLAPRFQRELASQPRDQLLDERAVEGAIRRMDQSPSGRRRASPPWFRWAAAAALLVFGVTGAAAVIGRRIASRPAVEAPVPAAEPPAPRAPIRPLEAPPAEAPPPPESPRANREPSSHGHGPPAITAGALFERGETLRRGGRMDAAIATYRRLQTTFPETAESRLSFAIAGQLLLKQGRPGDALAQFERHLKAGGEVGEEALAGRATALERLRRTADAIAAWKSLLARYPGSVYAERARTRLDQLIERQ
jgi:TolA-binding protein